MEDPTDLLVAVLNWAHTHQDILAVIQTGSRGRGNRVDAYSDLDLEIITPAWRSLYDNGEWLTQIGEVLLNVAFDQEENLQSGERGIRLVVFRGGRKIDFTLASARRISDQATELSELYQRGYSVLFDREGIAGVLPAPTGVVTHPVPTAAEFLATVEEFWFEASQLPIYIARGDLWTVKFRTPSLHNRLLAMLEWYARTDPAGPRDTWHIGHHMEEWLPPEIYDRVRQVYAHFDAADSYRALLATTTLFRDVTAITAGRLGYPDSRNLAETVLGLLTGYASQIGQSAPRR